VGQVKAFPARYDYEAQKTVKAAWIELTKMGTAAFPLLVEHLDDQRYCDSRDLAGDMYNFTVAAACRCILRDQLEPYHDFLGGRTGLEHLEEYSYVHEVIGNKDTARTWLASHRNQQLWELQAEAIEWLLKIIPNYDDNEDIEVEALRQLLAQLRQEKQPLSGNEHE
jgi:hypothetical protein